MYLCLELLELIVLVLPVLLNLLLCLVSSFLDTLCAIYPVSLQIT